MSSQNINLKNFSSPDSPLSGEEKKEKIKTLRAKLGELQLKIQEQKLPVLVLVEGWGASGKGSRISSMIRELDPRVFPGHLCFFPQRRGTCQTVFIPPHEKHSGKWKIYLPGLRMDG